MTAVEVAFTQDSGGLGQAISAERAFQEAARRLRASAGAEAVAVALASGESGSPRLVFQTGFPEDSGAVESELRSEWMDALGAAAGPKRRVSEDGVRITCALRGETIRGAVTALLDVAGSPSLESAEAGVRLVAGELALALDRAEAVRRLVRKGRLDATGEIAAAVAHELRNPVFGISSAVQLLRFRLRDDPIVEKNVGRILREVERLGAMAAALLDYGRLAPIRTQPGDPDDVWDDVLETQRGTLESRALVVRRTRALPALQVPIDAEQIAQAFTNVLVNAVEAAPEGSDLVLVSSAMSPGGWRCRLHNDGEALAPEALASALDLFGSTKPERVGIGLPLAERIVEAHGGRIVLDNASDGGVDLDIVLPAVGR